MNNCFLFAMAIMIAACTSSCGPSDTMSPSDEETLKKKLEQPLGAPGSGPKPANPKATKLQGAGQAPATG